MHYSFSNPAIGSLITVNDKLLVNKVVLLVFVSAFCSRCIVLKKSITQLEEVYQKLPIVFVDIATKEFLEHELKIESVPAVLLIKNKTIVFSKEGLLSLAELQWIFNLGINIIKYNS
ncbi:MAG: hypothetical protein HeimC3_19080 [Candidatus Heimdallarchaeota archaeon LC_3]|nr:MAG: hypothetical protein HeimC3_19080 [Candidatus Heimdallarchaeota archaeon LC_3]